MENKNINDIIIEDAETSKGNQLKNILTLLALLFIILVISIVITKLILGGDDDTDATHLRTDATVQEAGESNLTGTISNGVASALRCLASVSSSPPKISFVITIDMTKIINNRANRVNMFFNWLPSNWVGSTRSFSLRYACTNITSI